MIYAETGSFDLMTIKMVLKGHPLSFLTTAMILAGILSKSATLPFQTWLPDAGVAPSPVTALLHAAVLVKIGVYVFARLFIATFPIEQIWHTVVPAIAVISAIVAAGAAMIDTDLKRIIAYSTISQIGFIFLGLAVGNIIGIVGGLLYILMHGLAKAGLFLCAGIIEQNTKTKDITKMGGLISTMPLTALAFIGCAFSVMGIPPFGGFFSKYLVFMGAVQSKQWVITGGVPLRRFSYHNISVPAFQPDLPGRAKGARRGRFETDGRLRPVARPPLAVGRHFYQLPVKLRAGSGRANAGDA